MKYGKLPKSLGIHKVDVEEMFFYQDMPIKLAGQTIPQLEDRLLVFNSLVGKILCDFIGTFGIDAYVASNVYISAKHLYQKPGCEYNRPGYHSDGFMSDDINYIWCSNTPTIFNDYTFTLSQDHTLSIQEMEEQASFGKEITYSDFEILMLDQFTIHKVGECKEPGLRAFLKISFSKDQFNLIGNAHNSLLQYEWPMVPRNLQRNNPSAK